MHHLSTYGYEPSVVLADGSAAISKAIRDTFPKAVRAMCYAHTKRQARKRVRSGVLAPFREDILNDIELVRYARSRDEFELRRNLKAQNCLTHRQSLVSREMLESWPPDFADYFRSTWVNSDICLWYEAATAFCSTNNGLERANRDVKENQTLRRKWPFPQWLQSAKDMVHYWSVISEVRGHRL